MADLQKIDTWLSRIGLSEAYLGALACRNARAVARIRAGTATLSTLESVLSYIKANPAKKSR